MDIINLRLWPDKESGESLIIVIHYYNIFPNWLNKSGDCSEKILDMRDVQVRFFNTHTFRHVKRANPHQLTDKFCFNLLIKKHSNWVEWQSNESGVIFSSSHCSLRVFDCEIFWESFKTRELWVNLCISVQCEGGLKEY